MRTLTLYFMLVALVFPAASVRPTRAQQSKADTTAPIPTQIGTAKKAFIANSGGECSPFGQAGFSGGPDVAYNEYYAAMKQWGRLSLVSSPVDADLIMEIHFTCPVYFEENLGKVDAQLRVVLRDPRTNVQLWGITEHSQPAAWKKNRDKEFEIAMSKLISDVQSLMLLAADQPNPNK